MDDISGLPPEEPEEIKPELPKNKSLYREPPPLPATRADLDAQLKIVKQKSLNDWVHELHRMLWEDPNYSRYFKAIYHSQAVEGFLRTDHQEAARYLRDYARSKEIDEVSNELLHSIEKALNVVRRRYDLDVQTRQNMVDGQIVPGGEEDAADKEDE